jgi:diacylglycerol kinase (ATP)
VLVVVNADAGSADGVNEAIAALGDVDVCRTASPEELDEVVRRDDLIVVAGGDGSLHAVVTSLQRTDRLHEATLALLPLGTGNDFARGVGIPLEPAEAAATVRHGIPTPVDLLVDDAGGVVVNAAHVGAGAAASRRAEPWKRRLGPIGYVVGAAITAVHPPMLRLRVTVDGSVVSDRRTLQVAIGNAPYVGGGTPLTPEADPSDGRIDVLISHAVGPLARIAYALRLLRGAHHRREDVRYQRAREVTVEGRGFYASADGEIQGPLSRRSWRLQRGALTMLLPPS